MRGAPTISPGAAAPRRRRRLTGRHPPRPRLPVRGFPQMSVRSNRIHVLAAATALVLASTAAGSAFAAERVNLSGLQTAAKFDRFIVKYRDGSVERSSTANVQRALSAAAGASGAKAKGAALGLKHLRRTAIGADVVRA